MTKLNSNGGDDKVDELLKERYDLAKDRIVEICTETTVKPDFLDFFQNMAAFLEKTAVILERDEEKLSIEELQKENTELYKELFPQNYTHCYGNPAYAAYLPHFLQMAVHHFQKQHILQEKVLLSLYNPRFFFHMHRQLLHEVLRKEM